MRFVKAIHLFLLLFFFSNYFLWQCSSTQKNKSIVLSDENFDELLWKSKVIYLESFTSVSPDEKEKLIHLLKYAFSQKQKDVMMATADTIGNLKLHDLSNLLLNGLKHPNSMVRWHCLLALDKLPITPDNLKNVVSLTRDKEWLVRELAFKMIRKYEFEKTEKKYYYRVLTSLNDHNESVLKQIYQTLRWYDDRRTFSYVYQRSFRAKNTTELIFILRELGKYDSSTVKKRLYYLANNHQSSLVRNEAKKLLLKMK